MSPSTGRLQVASAAKLWDGTGSALFTSSAGVYAQSSGTCTEHSPVKAIGDTERTDRLLGAEQAMLDAGGNVLRCVGLYHSSRGAHTAFLNMQEVGRSGDSVINLVHYQDAASMAAAVRSMAAFCIAVCTLRPDASTNIARQ